MTTPQVIVLGTLGAALILFAWGRWQDDLVAFFALLAVVLTGIFPAGDAYLGFAHRIAITMEAIS